MSDRRVLAVSAAAITAAIFLFLLGTYPSWKAAIGNGPSWRGETLPASEHARTEPSAVGGAAQPSTSAAGPTVSTAPARTDASPITPPPAMKADAASTAPVPTPAPDAAAEPTVAKTEGPSFDIVRVEPSGDSVVAARAAPGATVTLLDQGHAIAQAKADGSGQVAFVPPTLAPGEHSLMLSLGQPDAAGRLSSQSVAVSVPAQPKAAPMVALLQPEQPTRLLSTPVAAGTPGPAAVAPPISVGTIDVEEMGSVFATGHAAPGSQCRIYLNGSFVANVTTGKDGTWSLKIEHGMKPGHYTVRVDQLASAAGEVQARAEVPFDYPARTASNMSLLRPRKGTAALPVAPLPSTAQAQPINRSVPTLASPVTGSADGIAGPAPGDQAVVASVGAMDPAPSEPSAAIPTVVAQLLTTKVTHGDSLWRISRKMLGHGRRYTQIYAANTSQIRNPRLIYPGQIFVMPQDRVAVP